MKTNVQGMRLRLLMILLVLLAMAGCGGSRAPSTEQDLSPEEAVRQMRGSAADANLVICVLDAARPDHFGCYGYPRDTTPNVDSLGEESFVFDAHYCQFTCTGPSTAALFTGQYPETNLIHVTRELGDEQFTLARGLEEAGFRTALFSSNVMPVPTGPYGLGTDFEEVFSWAEIDRVRKAGELRHYAPEPLLRLVDGWLSEATESRFFAYVHFTPPHGPWEPPDDMVALFAGQDPPQYDPETHRPGVFEFPLERENPDVPALPEWINLYDANLRYADWAVGELVRLLREHDVWDNTVVVVTADHGEAFGEHGFVGHGAPVHIEVSHIALIIRVPEVARFSRRIEALREAVDLLPTVFDLFGLPHPRAARYKAALSCP